MSRRKRLPVEPAIVTIESLSHEGRGIARVDGKTTFVDEGLPGEELEIQFTRMHPRYAEAKILNVLKPSPERISPPCRFYSICGGCSFQHVDNEFQIQHKQHTLLEQLRHSAGVTLEIIIPPLTGPTLGYRRRARLGVKYVDKKQKLLVGFREKRSPYVADIDHCVVLHPSVGNLIEPLHQLLSGLTVYREVPQLEVAVSDAVTALVIRHLAPFVDKDLELLRQFEKDHDIVFYLQPGGYDTVHLLSPERNVELVYSLPDFGLSLRFEPADFIQVNADINQAMIKRAIELLDPQADDEVLDLFCGLGNFSLPLAGKCRQVNAVEGDSGLIKRARQNAERNRISNVTYIAADLAKEQLDAEFMQKHYARILIDPPRVGANEIIKQLDFSGTERIVYVSCNPATLARDAGYLIKHCGFHLQQAGVMDMFPHTTHVESIALFVR